MARRRKRPKGIIRFGIIFVIWFILSIALFHDKPMDFVERCIILLWGASTLVLVIWGIEHLMGMDIYD